jgi:septal ring factor EnvC (AmiA/AmiB activator)
VSQLIEALQRNQSYAEKASALRQEAMHETTQLRVQLEAQEREKKRLDDQLTNSEARFRELKHELERLKPLPQKSP